MITFDDSWAGVFRLALPLLAERGIPALCFVNMGTVAGDPDLAALTRYLKEPPPPLGLEAGRAFIADIRGRYGEDPAFRAYRTRSDYRHSTNGLRLGSRECGAPRHLRPAASVAQSARAAQRCRHPADLSQHR